MVIEATIKRKFHKGDIVMINGNVETVKTADIDRVYTEESWERGGYFPGHYDPRKVVLLETAEEAQAHRDMIDEQAMYAELSRGM